jgi:Reverse transcriptase (RNA-dependent DNA polymerase)
VKKKVDGSIERYKTRLVTNGYTQEERFDYFHTFSHVIKPTTVIMVLNIALSNHRQMHRSDINNYFLYKVLEEIVYMQQPSGFSDPLYLFHVCKLKKNTLWFETNTSGLISDAQTILIISLSILYTTL